jgi:hypothetical protein
MFFLEICDQYFNRIEVKFLRSRFFAQRPLFQLGCELADMDFMFFANLLEGVCLILVKADSEIVQYSRKDIVLGD